MSENRNSKYIHTTIKYDLWLRAQCAEISWSEALEVGINVLLGSVPSEEELLIIDINKASAELSFKQKKLQELRDKKQEKKEEELEKEWEESKIFANMWRRDNPLRYARY